MPIKQLAAWEPTEKQWWVTGFNPSYFGNVDASKQVMICSVDFSENIDMYKELEKDISENNYELLDFLVFDEINSTIWICWYERSAMK